MIPNGLIWCQENPGPDSASIWLDAISVNAYQLNSTLRKIPGSLSVITANDLKVRNEPNLAAIFNRLPGVSAHTGTYTTNRIVIRGMGSRTPYNTNRIRIYINDIPFTGSDGLSSPEELDIKSFSRIELIKGPSSALYGSGLGGSISLFTPADTSTRIETIARFGNYGTWKANIIGSAHPKKVDIWGNLSHLQSEGYRENSRYERTSMFNTIQMNKRQWSLEGLILITRVRGELPSSLGRTMFKNEPESAAPNWESIRGYKEYFRLLGGLSISRQLSHVASNKLILFGKGIFNYEKRPFNNLNDQTLGGGIRDKFFLHWERIDWVLGTEIFTDTYRWKLDTTGFRINENREIRNQFNVFSMMYYRPSSEWTLSLAAALNCIRYSLTDMYGGNGDQTGKRSFPLIWSPRLGINYSPNDHFSLYFSSGHGFSMPSPEETLLPGGNVNPYIRHEQGWQLELGTRTGFLQNRLYVDGALYFISLSNLLLTKRISEDIFTGENAGKTHHKGVEIMLKGLIFAKHQFPGKLHATVTYTRSVNRFISFTDNGQSFDNNLLPGIPDQTAYLEADWSLFPFLELNSNIYFSGRQYLNDENSLVYNGYSVTNIVISGLFVIPKIGRFNVYAGINNLFNVHYASMLVVNAVSFNMEEPRYYYPGLPLNLYVGFRYVFQKA